MLQSPFLPAYQSLSALTLRSSPSFNTVKRSLLTHFQARTDIIKSVERAHYFMNWSPSQTSESTPEIVHQKKFVFRKLLITSLGYMTLMEEGVLEKGDGHNHHREGYYRWWGPFCRKRTGMNSGVERLQFSIEDEYTEIS